MFDHSIVSRIERDQLVLPCWDADPEMFFAESPADVETAKAVCRTCPVRPACLAAALDRAEPWGVWGGELVVTGTVVPRKRPRGRPRKVRPEEVAA
ncbi:Transcriptional regulator WhiB [Frankia canadensis]|uniref:Transcriptional regulator WhiB n=1 Tax=Frankia canadensis TaxID=1836972 RepID=A0A2I2KK41_9ACTN|nr:WhiB family transcriptional regulator [Frankia canadensis]SNQ46039.1 Transcriptional regulator WhiB [Frankia canadensis]SOU53329.1 Transcriptional regulator WhiB [Frankia canadensis]